MCVGWPCEAATSASPFKSYLNLCESNHVGLSFSYRKTEVTPKMVDGKRITKRITQWIDAKLQGDDFAIHKRSRLDATNDFISERSYGAFSNRFWTKDPNGTVFWHEGDIRPENEERPRKVEPRRRARNRVARLLAFGMHDIEGIKFSDDGTTFRCQSLLGRPFSGILDTSASNVLKVTLPLTKGETVKHVSVLRFSHRTNPFPDTIEHDFLIGGVPRIRTVFEIGRAQSHPQPLTAAQFQPDAAPSPKGWDIIVTNQGYYMRSNGVMVAVKGMKNSPQNGRTSGRASFWMPVLVVLNLAFSLWLFRVIKSPNLKS